MSHEQPERLAQREDLARLLSRANGEFEAGVDEAVAFRRLTRRLSDQQAQRGSFPWRELLWSAAAALLILGVVSLFRQSNPAPAHAGAATATPTATARAAALAATPAPGAAASPRTALRTGKHTLADGSHAELDARASGSVQRLAEGLRVTLDAGSVELHVAKQAPGQTFELDGGGYRFQVLGTVFRVLLSEQGASLDVREGRVAVWRDHALLARVGAGQHWDDHAAPSTHAVETAAVRAITANPPAQPALSTAPVTEATVASAEPDCLSLARSGAPHDAERCFQKRALGHGLGAEMALYEVARLRRDVLGDPNGALEALREHRQRFPNGALRREAEVSLLELLIQLGRSQDALAQSQQLLASPSGGERAAELRLLRGTIFRRSLSDLNAAVREYELAEPFGGPSGAEALYLRGTCLELLGQRDAAVAAYRRYLALPQRPREADVRRRLAAFTP